MKWQLVATIIEDPGYTNKVSHVHVSIERDRLRCTCKLALVMIYIPGEVEGPSYGGNGGVCQHIRGLWDDSVLMPAKINFTAVGLEEFAWRWAAKKLEESAH
jgi:hypothetical protein